MHPRIISLKSMLVLGLVTVFCLGSANWLLSVGHAAEPTDDGSPLSEARAEPPVYFVPDVSFTSFRAGNARDVTLDGHGVTLDLERVPIYIRFPGASPHVMLMGRGPAAVANYYIGNDPAQWRQDVPMYAQVLYRQLYPGIDLTYEFRAGKLESEFIVQPGVDPNQIRVAYEGVESLELEAKIKLRVKLASGETLYETLPNAYQLRSGQRVPVGVEFRLINDATYRFAVGGYDPSEPLVIDPVLLYATFLGGSQNDEGWAIAADNSGSTYITGITDSPDFPVASQGQISYVHDADVFIAKLNAAGNLVYTTVLGGLSGEQGNGIAVDSMGYAYVGGETFSPDFPVLNAWQPRFAGYEDAFVLRLDPTGRLVYSTFIGGTGPEEIDDIAIDAGRNVYVGGEVYSDDYPLLNPWQSTTYGPGDEDGFLSIFDANGQLIYSTYVGADQRDQIFRLTVDDAGYVYGTGMTSSPGFPVVNAAQSQYGGGWDDCFVFKFDPWHNQMIYSTFLGGMDRDECWGIAVDDAGYAYVTGFTLSLNFPVVNPIQPVYAGNADVILAKLDPQGNAFVYSTVLGGEGTDRGWGLTLDSGGNVYVTGETNSVNFPQVDALQPVYGGGVRDAFLLRLDNHGAVRYSSFLGGQGFDHGWRVTVDRDWVVHVTGATDSPDFVLASPAQGAPAGLRDAFVARFGLSPTPTPAPTPTPFAQSTIGPGGGALWMTTPGHLTMLSVPAGAVSAETVFTLANDAHPNEQGDLQGIDHFFKLKAQQGLTEPTGFHLPLELTLGYPGPGATTAGSLTLYRLEAGGWLTRGITVTDQSTNLMTAWIEQMGAYGLLGRTNRVYLPLVLRH